MNLNNSFQLLNKIAYDKDLRDKIEKLHSLFGNDIADIVASVNGDEFKCEFEIGRIRGRISDITSKLNIYLIDGEKNGIEKFEDEVNSELKKLVDVISLEVVSNSFTSKTNISEWLESSAALREEMSSLTSGLTVSLMKARERKQELSESEQTSERGVKMLVDSLGNFTFYFTKLIEKVKSALASLDQVVVLANPLMDKITVFMNTFKLHKADSKVVKKVVEFLGNLDFSLNQTLLKIEIYEAQVGEVNELSDKLMHLIMETQRDFREVRSEINDLGPLSKNLDMALAYSQINGDSDINK